MTYGTNKLFNDTTENVIGDAIAEDVELAVLEELYRAREVRLV